MEEKPCSEKRWIDNSIGTLTSLIELAELAIAVFMVIIIFLGLGYLITELAADMRIGLFLNSAEIHHFLDVVLTLFIVIELVRLTFGYLTGQNIWVIVAETAFIALGRKIILFEYKQYGLQGAIALAILTIVAVFAYYVYKHITKEAMTESSS